MGQLLATIASSTNLRVAFAKVKRNAGAAGVDGLSIAAFEANLDRQIASLRQRLLSAERYQPPPVRRVEIKKLSGGKRPLGIPTVADRVVQQATLQVIGPVFESRFLDSSYGFRPHRGAKAAVARVRDLIKQGDSWVAEFDVEAFFDSLSHTRLLREVRKVIDDAEVVGLIRRWLKAGALSEDGIRRSLTTGTPQGGVISPLLANIYLHRLDEIMQQNGFRYVRYADDFVVLANRRWKAHAADQIVRALLADIGLHVSEAKSGVCPVRDGFEFLGFAFRGRFLRPRPRAVLSFKNQIRRLTRRQAGISLAQMIARMNPVVRGWGNYFASGHVASLFRDLDQWVRMRLRSYLTKRRAPSPRINAWYPTKRLQTIGLVLLVDLRLSHAP